MAGIIDDEVVEVQPTVVKELEDVSEDLPQQEQPQEEIPDKYKGKSVSEIVRMHQEAEKLIGKQGSEVGELRKVVDDFIRSQTLTKPQKEEEVEEVDFFADPEKAVKRAVDNHPSVKEAQEVNKLMRREQTLAKLQQKYPDFASTVQDPSFVEWIKGSKIRMQLAAAAESQFDYDAADELLSNWTERKQVASNMAKTAEVDRKQQLKSADVGTNGSSPATSKKKYRRADIIKLMQTDPSRYEALQDEIMKAYSEGRVI